MRLLQINAAVNYGSTGLIAEDIGTAAIANGYESYIAAADTSRKSKSEVITIGNDFDKKLHGVKSLLLDRHGFGSSGATNKLVSEIKRVKPDIIHLHNLHGYYLHIGILFNYLKQSPVPVVWTFHDCWPFTGHCSFFDAVNCFKWQTHCNKCPNLKGYPSSYGLDQSERNFKEKREIFNGVRSLRIVTPSNWLANHVRKSFLAGYPVEAIHNGVDTNIFKSDQPLQSIFEKYGLKDKPIVLGVANVWDKRKGLNAFIELSKILPADFQIMLVGLTPKQIAALPANIKGIERTKSIEELAALYAAANVFVNPTTVDNFPTTNIEALSCGTPVITYNTGGSPEAIDSNTGFVVAKGDIKMLGDCIQSAAANGKLMYSKPCRERALQYFNKDDRYRDYLNLYQQLMN